MANHKKEVSKSSSVDSEINPRKKNFLLWIVVIFVIVGVASLLFINGEGGSASGGNSENPDSINPDLIQVYFFWSATCPHCADQKPFMQDMKEKYPKIQLFSYEVQFDKENLNLFNKLLDDYNVPEPHGVPATFIGDDYYVGFSESIAVDIENKIVELSSNK